MTARSADAFPSHDDQVAAFATDLGLDGLVDLHVHAMPERLQQAVWAYFDQLDDPPWPIAYRDDQEALLNHLVDMGVVAHTALAYAHRSGMLGWLNDHTLSLAEQRPEVVPTFTIHPDPDVAEQTSAAIARGGAVVKVHTQVGRFRTTDPRLDDAWRQIAAARLPVMLHATAVYGVDGGEDWCGVDEVQALLERHPDLTIVLAHLGMPDYRQAIQLAETADEVFLDLSMTLHDGPVASPVPDDLLGRLHDLAPRLVFGSDYPSIPHTYATQVRAVAMLGLGDEALRRVFAGTARRLLARRRAPDG